MSDNAKQNAQLKQNKTQNKKKNTRMSQRQQLTKQMAPVAANNPLRRKVRGLKSEDLFGFVDGIVRFAPIVMPRPIPTPSASYVLQRVISITAPAATPLSGVIYAQPDLRFPMVTYYNDSSIGRTLADTFEFAISKTVLLPSESFFVDNTVIHIIPQLISSLTHNLNVRPSIIPVSTGSISIYPDYRDPDVFKIGSGGKGYYNLSIATTALTNMPAQFKVTGVFSAPPVMDIVWYPSHDLQGASTVIPLASTTISGDEFNFNSSGTIYVNPGSLSFTYTLKNVVRLDSFSVISSSAFTQATSFEVILGENVFAVSTSEADSWGSTLKLIEGWAPTGLSLTATSVSSQAFSGGNIAVGLLPVSVTALTDYQGVYDTIVSRRSFKYTGPVINGAHGLWAPRTLSDVSDLNSYTSLQSNLVAIAFNYPASGAAAPELKLTLTMRYDLQVNSLLIPSVIPFSSPTALARIFAMLREHLSLVYGDNPTHMERIKDVVKSIMNSRTFAALVDELGVFAVEKLASYAPLALSFI